MQVGFWLPWKKKNSARSVSNWSCVTAELTQTMAFIPGNWWCRSSWRWCDFVFRWSSLSHWQNMTLMKIKSVCIQTADANKLTAITPDLRAAGKAMHNFSPMNKNAAFRCRDHVGFTETPALPHWEERNGRDCATDAAPRGYLKMVWPEWPHFHMRGCHTSKNPFCTMLKNIILHGQLSLKVWTQGHAILLRSCFPNQTITSELQ